MKPGSISTGRVLLSMLVAGTVFTLISWTNKQNAPIQSQRQFYTDTVPQGKKEARERKIRDLDEALEEMDAVDWKIEMEKMQKELQEALKEVDKEKIKMEIDKAMKEVDMAKIQKEINESMSALKIDLDKMQQEFKESLGKMNGENIQANIEKAMKQVDMARIQEEIKESMAKVDWEKIKTEMEKTKEIDMEKLNQEMEKVKVEMEKAAPRIEKEMQKAKVQMEKVKEELKEYKSFVDGLEKDGLIRKSEGYTIHHEDGELTINGKKASPETYAKYRSFLDKHKKFTLKKSDDDFNLNTD